MCIKNRYETTAKNAGETNEIKADAIGTGTLDGFGDQDPFASNKAKEAFSAPISDPFGSAFPAQQSNVSFFLQLCSHSLLSALLFFYEISCKSGKRVMHYSFTVLHMCIYSHFNIFIYILIHIYFIYFNIFILFNIFTHFNFSFCKHTVTNNKMSP